MGIIGIYFIFILFLLISRFWPLEHFYGHDILSYKHRRQGKITLIILLFHPVLLVLGYGMINELNPLAQYLQFFTEYPYVWMASISLFLLILVVVTSLTIIRAKWRYEAWYWVHLLVYLATLGGIWHQFANGGDLVGRGAFYFFWLILYIVVFGIFLVSRFLVPVLRFARHGFYVSRIERETHDVISIYIEGNLKFQPGQFILVRFLARGFWYESHPFTISGSPLRITPKAVGDFSSKLSNLPLGTKVLIEGPLGRFTADRAQGKPTLLIAGGIGVTPLRVLFEEFTRASPRLRRVDLIYAARSNQDFALKNELDRIGSVLYTTEKLTPEFIKNQIPDVAQRFVYLCGPPPMMEVVQNMLKNLGVPKKNILYEKFQLG